MPASVGPFVGFALGAALAWLCRDDARGDDDPAFRARAVVVALFAVLVFAPACAYFLAFAGDWSLFYQLDSRDVPSALGLLLVVADAGAVVLGFIAGHRAARRHAERATVALVSVPAALAFAQLLAFLPKLRVDGTFHQVTSRFGTQPAAGSPLGWAILWMGAMIAAGFVIAARLLGERPRLAPPPEAKAETTGPQPMLGRRRR
ncbi:hypothetical protein A7982_12737 [Minicystis rosea]|nr:hypothetical protein A7982_12737 [Minicystis rosea]